MLLKDKSRMDFGISVRSNGVVKVYITEIEAPVFESDKRIFISFGGFVVFFVSKKRAASDCRSFLS